MPRGVGDPRRVGAQRLEKRIDAAIATLADGIGEREAMQQL